MLYHSDHSHHIPNLALDSPAPSGKTPQPSPQSLSWGTPRYGTRDTFMLSTSIAHAIFSMCCLQTNQEPPSPSFLAYSVSRIQTIGFRGPWECVPKMQEHFPILWVELSSGSSPAHGCFYAFLELIAMAYRIHRLTLFVIGLLRSDIAGEAQ